MGTYRTFTAPKRAGGTWGRLVAFAPDFGPGRACWLGLALTAPSCHTGRSRVRSAMGLPWCRMRPTRASLQMPSYAALYRLMALGRGAFFTVLLGFTARLGYAPA